MADNKPRPKYVRPEHAPQTWVDKVDNEYSAFVPPGKRGPGTTLLDAARRLYERRVSADGAARALCMGSMGLKEGAAACTLPIAKPKKAVEGVTVPRLSLRPERKQPAWEFLPEHLLPRPGKPLTSVQKIAAMRTAGQALLDRIKVVQVRPAGLAVEEEFVSKKPKKKRKKAAKKAAAAKPAKEKPAKEKPAKEKPAAKPAKEKPAKEKPAKEKPAKEKPAKEKPAKEKPAREKPAKPAREKPVQEKPAKATQATAKPAAAEKPAKPAPKPAKASQLTDAEKDAAMMNAVTAAIRDVLRPS